MTKKILFNCKEVQQTIC